MHLRLQEHFGAEEDGTTLKIAAEMEAAISSTLEKFINRENTPAMRSELTHDALKVLNEKFGREAFCRFPIGGYPYELFSESFGDDSQVCVTVQIDVPQSEVADFVEEMNRMGIEVTRSVWHK